MTYSSSSLRTVTASSKVRGLALLLLGAFLASSPLGAADPAPGTPWYEGRLSGQSRSVYQYRSSEGERDSDFYEYLYIRDRDLANRRLDFYASGRLHRDLDGASTSLADDEFASVEDVSSTREDYLFQLYLDAHDRAKRVLLRAGRQYIDVADGLHVDGAQLTAFEYSWLGGRVFGGRPVSYYSPVSGDWAGGFSVNGRPWARNETRLTYVRYHDDSENVDDERYTLETRQRWLEAIRSRVKVSELNSRFEMADLDLYYDASDGDFGCYAGVRRWGGAAGDTTAYSPLVQVLGDREPYTYVRGRIYKSLLPWLYVSPEVTARFVDDTDEDARNRDYVRYDLTLAVEPAKAWSVSVAGEYWDVQEGDSFVGVSGEVRYRRRRLWEVSAGAGYLHYEYVQYSDFAGTSEAGDVRVESDGTAIESSPDSYSYYVSGKWNLNKTFSLQVRGETEDNSETDERSYLGQTALVIRI